MNKKLLLAGFIAASFITLTAFAAKTLAEQKAEIDAAVQSKLTELRTMKEQECSERVMTEAQRRFDEAMAAKAAEEAAKPGAKKPIKKGGAKGPKVDPLPQGSTPSPTNPKDAKMEKQPNTEAKDSKIMQKPNTDSKDAKMKKTQSGGGGK